MNFKKTCKSIVSFVLGTGMMFSGFAFNSHPNAIFSKEFYAENLEKYKGNKNMELLLASLEKLQENREKLSVKIPGKLITKAEKCIDYALTAFGTAVEAVTKELNRKEKTTLIVEQSALKAVEKCEAFETARHEFEQAKQKAIAELHNPDRTTASLGKEQEQIQKTNKPLSDTCAPLRETYEELENAQLALILANAICDHRLKNALRRLTMILKYLIALSVCETDETNHLCLDTLAPQIETLFGGNSTELEMHIRDTVNRLLGDETYERVVKSIID